MSISVMLEMVAATDPDRVAVVSDGTRVTGAELGAMADRAAGLIGSSGADHVAYVGTGGIMLPLLLFGSARAGKAFTPLNYRLGAGALRELVDRLPAPLVVVDAEYSDAVAGSGKQIIDSAQFLADARTDAGETETVEAAPEDLAVLLFTSGTTSRPKAVELSHANLTSYVMGTVDFASADPDDAALICVPPYHIAGVGAALSNLYAGRKMVYLRQFDASDWLDLVRREAVTNATVVPTMLDRIVTALRARTDADLSSLRTLAYGGSKAPLPLVRAALELLPGVGLVNAYGLTETSSTIAVSTPEDHRDAYGSDDPAIARRLASVGRAVPGVELEVRGPDGTVLPPGEVGELFVRGPQVSGSYAEIGSVLDADGWFPTKDLAELDADGYLFLGGRSDDTIIRGGENIAPAELEDVLIEHPEVREVAVIGIPDPQWGQIIVAAVVPVPGATPDPEALRAHVRTTLRGSRTPDRVVFRDELPVNATGKVLRRVLVEELTPAPTPEESS
ncbi:class I adenylate-forming enzyme family protein [Nocardia bovistercoris]|uniref:AMP-binding protein n=1 Tax=Nocardia bovistercoris TaxID=2785916 RepID=A0A931ID73_9NOCA|nr:AMP-binding protein [Nocardia bovistercoris]MBH0777977.1 AMP-binding protein [Nocardia bovistercoris]